MRNRRGKYTSHQTKISFSEYDMLKNIFESHVK